jgi:hypothetical protein
MRARVALELDDDVRKGAAHPDHPSNPVGDEEGRHPVNLREALVGEAGKPCDVGDDVEARPQF